MTLMCRCRQAPHMAEKAAQNGRLRLKRLLTSFKAGGHASVDPSHRDRAAQLPTSGRAPAVYSAAGLFKPGSSLLVALLPARAVASAHQIIINK